MKFWVSIVNLLIWISFDNPFRIDYLDGESDFAAFSHVLGVPSVNLMYTSDSVLCPVLLLFKLNQVISFCIDFSHAIATFRNETYNEKY